MSTYRVHDQPTEFLLLLPRERKYQFPLVYESDRNDPPNMSVHYSYTAL